MFLISIGIFHQSEGKGNHASNEETVQPNTKTTLDTCTLVFAISKGFFKSQRYRIFSVDTKTWYGISFTSAEKIDQKSGLEPLAIRAAFRN